jgi:hypothetical protein
MKPQFNPLMKPIHDLKWIIEFPKVSNIEIRNIYLEDVKKDFVEDIEEV